MNHEGDWDSVYMPIQFMADTKTLRSSVTDLQSYYKEAKQRFDIDEEFAKKSKELVVKLQSYEPKTPHMWKKYVKRVVLSFKRFMID